MLVTSPPGDAVRADPDAVDAALAVRLLDEGDRLVDTDPATARDRYSTALARVDSGERRWVDSPEIDSCHTVWAQLHEDLLATLGLPRGPDT